MMSDFMCDHVCLRKISTGSEALIEFLEKSKVDVHLAVERAIEGSDRGRTQAAGGLNTIGEQDQLGRRVVGAGLRKQLCPGVFRICEDGRNKIFLFIVGGALL